MSWWIKRPSVRFVPSAEMLALLERIPSLGAISGSDTDRDPAECTAVGDGLKEAKVGKEATVVVTAFDFEGERPAAMAL